MDVIQPVTPGDGVSTHKIRVGVTDVTFRTSLWTLAHFGPLSPSAEDPRPTRLKVAWVPEPPLQRRAPPPETPMRNVTGLRNKLFLG